MRGIDFSGPSHAETESEDKFDDVIGSFGVTGSTDGIILLIRKTGQADAELHITKLVIPPQKEIKIFCWN